VLDGVDKLLLLLGGVGVVEAQGEAAAILLGQPVVQADALGMPKVQVAVGLRGEAGTDDRAVTGLPPLSAGNIGIDDLLNEMATGSFRHGQW
jgi:hypothetical protein